MDTYLTGAEPMGTNQSGMRAQNERLVLTLIRRHGALPKAEIARLTNLSAQTVSVIIRALEDDGLLLRGAPQRGRVGQPSIPMQLNPRGALFLGLKIGRRSAELVLTDFLGAIVDRRIKRYAHPDYEEVLDFVTGAVAEVEADLPEDQRRRIAGLGVAIPFQLWDWARMIGVDPARMAAWRTRDVRADLSERFTYPIFLQNDATSACSAELVFGAGPQPPTFLHFYVAFFIGGGIVLDGGLFEGPSGNAGALGSMPVPDAEGTVRQLINLASLQTLETRVRGAGLDPALIWDDPDRWDLPPEIVGAWVAEAGDAIAHAIHSALAVIDFPVVKIDGWLPPDLRTALTRRVRSSLGRHDLTGLDLPVVVEGGLGPDARAIGAASQALLRRFLLG